MRRRPYVFEDVPERSGCQISPRSFRIEYHIGPVRHTDENAPATMPTMSGRANSLIDGTPTTYRHATVTNVVSDV